MARSEPPVLDARRRADVVARLVELARQAVPEWRPDAGPDPGTALQEIFGRLIELFLDRLNRAPEKLALAFLDVAGVVPQPPSAASTAVTFRAGEAPVLVPKGTALSGSAAPGAASVPFETSTDLTVLPAALVEAHVVDPVHDTDADVSALVSPRADPGAAAPSVEVPVFAAGTQADHVLHLGTDVLLDLARPSAVQLTLSLPDTGLLAADAWRRVRFVVTVAGQDVDITPSAPVVPVPTGEGRVFVTVGFSLASVDRMVLAGAGLPAPLPLRWLRLVLPGRLPPVPALLGTAQLEAVVTNLVPDAVLVGTDPADPSRDLLPFGATPAVGSTLNVGSAEGFGKAGAQVTLDLKVADAGVPQSVQLAVEYLGAGGWAPLTVGQSLTSVPSALTFRVPTPAPPVTMLGTTASRWVRVRMTAGDYGAPASYQPSGQGFTPVAATLHPPRLAHVGVGYEADDIPTAVIQCGRTLELAPDLPPITSAPDPARPPLLAFPGPHDLPPSQRDDDPAFYLGFDAAFPGLPVTLAVQVAPATLTSPAGGGQRITWDYWNGHDWHELTVLDGTAEFVQSGALSFATPSDWAPVARFGTSPRYWIRARSGGIALDRTPWLAGVRANAVPAVQGVTHPWEEIGTGNGQAWQSFTLPDAPVLAGVEVYVREAEAPSGTELAALVLDESPGVVVTRVDPVTGDAQTWVRWHEVAAFTGSGPGDRHFTFDAVTGIVQFGDGATGLIPPVIGGQVAASYRAGGGSAGNLAPGLLTRITAPVPGVAAVTNPWAADGGGEAEPVTDFLERAPHALRHRNRAVRPEDVAWSAREVAGTRVARAFCLPESDRGEPRQPGNVTVVVVPRSTDQRPAPSAQLLAEIADGLAARAPLALVRPTRRLQVVGPRYLQVQVQCDVVPTDLGAAEQVKRDVTDALDAFLNPLTGGPGGGGWPLGRPVYESEVAQVLGAVPGIQFVRSIRVLPAADQLRVTFADPLPATALLPLAGDRVATTDGRYAARVAEDAGSGAPVTSLALTGITEGDLLLPIGPADPPGLPPFRMTVASVRPVEPTGLLLAAARRLGGPPTPETVLRTADDSVRAVVVGPTAGGLVVAALQPGAQLTLRSGGVGLVREVASVAPVTSIAYVDPLTLVYPGPHVVRFVADPAAAGEEENTCPHPFPCSTTGRSMTSCWRPGH